MNSINLQVILTSVLKNKYSAFFYTPPIYEKATSYFFKKPTKTLQAKTIDEVHSALEILNKKYFIAYSIINYETGYALEKSLNKYYNENDVNLLINIFDKYDVKKFNSKDIEISGNGYSDYNIENFNLNVTEKEYKKNTARIKQYLIEGDTYQVNYTLKSKFDFSGDFISLYKTLLFNQSAKYSAFINLGDKILISISPELFFDIEENTITTLPMKGTIHRGNNVTDDLQNNSILKKSEKDRAENVMIVDLLRNDIGKLCEYGSVKTKELFSIEKYESLFQMVSKVTGKLKDKISFGEVVKNIFPCGSVTGAPKIRTMEIIKELEKEKRGIYTGTIGIIENEKATFNVAIRTLEIDKKSGEGEMGLGSGIVIDSDQDKEYEEIKLKGKFLSQPENYFELFETMLIENFEIKNWQQHIHRLKIASEYFLFCFDKVEINKTEKEILKNVQVDKQYRLKLLLNKYGKINYKISDFNKHNEPTKVILSEKRISSKNKFQYFKTTNRKLYNEEYQKWNDSDFFDVIFLNEKNELAESAISNIFLKIGDKWITPKIECGILNGIERGEMLKENSDIKESLLSIEDLKKAESIILTNSLRGRTFVDELHLKDGLIHYLSNK